MASYRACLGLSLPLFSAALMFIACDDMTEFDGGPEDKDGVNEVPSPSESNGPSMGVGGLGQGGEGGGGPKPCMTPSDCLDYNSCTIETCGPEKLCVTVSSADDMNACTEDSCDPRSGAVLNTPIVLDDMNACTFDACDPVTGPSHLPGRVLFAEDFSDNQQLWALGPQWTIGSAAPSTAGKNGGNDPAADHSPTDDDGVAGTALGGLVAATVPVGSVMTSPPIVVTAVPATEFVTLTFWRWLNADDPPEMTTFVRAFDGVGYVDVWNNTVSVIDAPPLGTGWTEIKIDITAEALACQTAGVPLRVAFGFSKGAAVPSIGGWNIDDLFVFQTKTQVDDEICTLDSCNDNAGVPEATSVPFPALDDGNDCTNFACVDNSGPQQVPFVSPPRCP